MPADHPPYSATPDCSATVHRIWLEAGAAPLPAPAHQSVLQSALAAGTEMLSACRNGTCRICIRRLASGRVGYRIDWPGLSAEEKAEGYILPCVAHPESDLVLHPPS